jgi:hypothetical protein
MSAEKEEQNPPTTTVLLDRAIPLPIVGSGVKIEPKASDLSPYIPKPAAKDTTDKDKKAS